MVDNGLASNGVATETPKKVFILVAHWASTKAIKATFNEHFGVEYLLNF